MSRYSPFGVATASVIPMGTSTATLFADDQSESVGVTFTTLLEKATNTLPSRYVIPSAPASGDRSENVPSMATFFTDLSARPIRTRLDGR